MVRKLTWGTITFLALAVVAYSLTALLLPSLRSPFVSDLFTNVPLSTAIHIAGGLIAIFMGLFQLNSSLRNKYLGAHRLMGQIYVGAVVAGGIAGFILALSSTGGLVGHFGFGLLAICWVGSTINAFRYIRQGNVSQHRIWMIRSYALTLAAVSLRIYLPLSLMAGIEFVAAYQVIAWLCWVPNILIAEWFVISRLRLNTTP